jgi:hypothetical protein
VAVESSEQRKEEDNAKEQFEQERLRFIKERQRREEQLAAMEKALRRAEEDRKKEAVAQAKLRSLGVCVAGFRWVKQSGGYRCAGGSHYVSDSQLR